jgi:hypothetical protein
MQISNLFKLSLISLITMTVASWSLAQSTEYIPNSNEITQCIQSKFKLAKSPEDQKLMVGTDYVCNSISYLASNAQTPRFHKNIGVNGAKPEYKFETTQWPGAYTNTLVPNDPEAIIHPEQYLPVDGAKLKGILAVKQGIHYGFINDFLRVTESGLIISEETVLNVDAKFFVINHGAPEALSDNKRVVSKYRLCAPVTADSQDIPCLK